MGDYLVMRWQVTFTEACERQHPVSIEFFANNFSEACKSVYSAISLIKGDVAPDVIKLERVRGL